MLVVKRGLLLALLLSTAGCYVYEPIRPADAVLDARVRATVSQEIAADIETAFRGTGSQLIGTLRAREGTDLLVDVPISSGVQGSSRAPMHNRVRIPQDGLMSLESRTLSAWRTGAVMGALVAAVAATWVVVGDDHTAPEKGPPEQNAAIRIRIPIGFGFR